MSEAASLASLFISSFLAATLLPGGSEVALFMMLKAYPETLWSALGIASLGNTLGGMVTFAMGWLLPQTQPIRHVGKVRQYGAPVLLFAWAPLVGDALCLGAGWLKFNPWQAALFMAVGKFARYWVIALASS